MMDSIKVLPYSSIKQKTGSPLHCQSQTLMIFITNCYSVLALIIPKGRPVQIGLASCDFPMWCPESDVVLNSIDSRSLPSYLL